MNLTRDLSGIKSSKETGNIVRMWGRRQYDFADSFEMQKSEIEKELDFLGRMV